MAKPTEPDPPTGLTADVTLIVGDPNGRHVRIPDDYLPVHSIEIKTDTGYHEPAYTRVTLDLMGDGTVRWRDFSED